MKPRHVYVLWIVFLLTCPLTWSEQGINTAEASYRRMERAFEQANHIEIHCVSRTTAENDQKQIACLETKGTLLVKKNDKFLLDIHGELTIPNNKTNKPYHINILYDVKNTRYKINGEIKQEPVIINRNKRIVSRFVCAGITGTIATAQEDNPPEYTVSDFQMRGTDTINGEGMTRIRYRLEGKEGEKNVVLHAELWMHSHTFMPVKRIFSSTQNQMKATITEEYTTIDIASEIRDERFISK